MACSCPSISRRSCPCRTHHSRPRQTRRSDRGSINTSSPLSHCSRPLSTRKNNGDYFNGDSDATAFAVSLNNIILIDFVSCSKIQTVCISVIWSNFKWQYTFFVCFATLNNLQLVSFENIFKNISNNCIYCTSIQWYSFFLIVTIKYLNQSFAIALHNSDFDKYSSSICILVALIFNLSQLKFNISK